MKTSVFRRKHWIALFLLSSLLLCGAEYPRFKVGKIYYSRLKDIAAQYSYKSRRGQTRMEVYAPAEKKVLMVFHKEKKYGYFNSTRIALAYPAVLNGNGSQVSHIDGIKTVKPLLDSGKLHRHPVRTIVLDPGHGGKDQGAAGGGILEKSLNLQLAQRVDPDQCQHRCNQQEGIDVAEIVDISVAKQITETHTGYNPDGILRNREKQQHK